MLDAYKRASYFINALMLGYADDENILAQIHGLKDEAVVYHFLNNEYGKGIFLYFIVD